MIVVIKKNQLINDSEKAVKNSIIVEAQIKKGWHGASKENPDFKSGISKPRNYIIEENTVSVIFIINKYSSANYIKFRYLSR